MFDPPHLPEKDLKGNAKREGLRNTEVDKTPNVLCTQDRPIGVDLISNERQIIESKEQSEKIKRENDDYMTVFRKQCMDALCKNEQILEDKLSAARELSKYMDIYQRKEDRREFDLNDPSIKLNFVPYRACEDDPRISISSFQKFQSEDPEGRRKKEQALQQKAWLLQQMVERKQLKEEKQSADRVFAETIKAREIRDSQKEQIQIENRRKIAKSNAEFNKAMAENKKMMAKIKHAEDVQWEVLNTMSSDLITENPESEEVAEIRLEQKSQMEAMKVKHEAERKEERIWDDLTNNFNKTLRLKDTGQERELREKQKHLLELRVALRKEQEQHREYLDKVVYSSKGPTNQF